MYPSIHSSAWLNASCLFLKELVVFGSWYGGKSATEAIDESVFSVSVAKDHEYNRGSQHAGTVERKVKADWNWPHPIVAEKGITSVANKQSRSVFRQILNLYF